MNWSEKLTTIKDNVPKVFEAGRQAEYDRFWDRYQLNGTRSIYDNFFRADGWNEETYNPKYEIRAKSISALFQGANITDTKVPIIYEGTYNTSNVFYGCRKLVTICNLTFVESPAHSNYSNWFYNCDALKNITIEGVIPNNISFQWSPLTVESMKSVLTHLKDLTDTDDAFTKTVKFSDACWALLDADGNTAPHGGTWREYANVVKCWNI